MLTGTVPYDGIRVYLALAGERVPAARPLDVASEQVRTCIESCVAVEPSHRPSAARILTVLASEFETNATLPV